MDTEIDEDEARLERAARAVAAEMGWAYSGPSLLADPSPRAREFVAIARAAIEA